MGLAPQYTDLTEPLHIAFDDMAQEVLRDGAFARSAIETQAALVVFNWIEPGMDNFPEHAHDYDQLLFILRGTIEMQIGGEAGTRYVVSAGELLYIPGGVLHTGRPLGNETVLNVDLLAPSRREYLETARG
jgi:mannose-6-phosphate isomerase-like protein (cupin superfamily)